jgi:hypothetical protein
VSDERNYVYREDFIAIVNVFPAYMQNLITLFFLNRLNNLEECVYIYINIYYLFIYAQERTNKPITAEGICPTVLVY